MFVVKNISKKLKNFMLANISFNFENSETVAFVGDNGAGKTTLIKSIFGFYNLDAGEIFYNEKPIQYSLNRISYFPDSNNMTLNIVVIDYLKYIAKCANVTSEEFNERMKSIEQMLQIDSFLKKTLKNLSAGQKKRVLMAGSLITKPELIFFDEPTANLDIKSRDEFITIVKKLKENGVGVFITSHDISELQEIADRLIIIKNGTIFFDKKIDNKTENIKEIYEKYIDEKKVNFEGVNSIYESK